MTKRAILVTISIVLSSAAFAQSRQSPKTLATVDMTGYWVSIVNEDWMSRMKGLEKGDVSGIPATPVAQTAANAWDPAKDEAQGNACKSYGGAAIMRVPTRIHITWADENTLKLETDAGRQTRLFHFDSSAKPSRDRTWQGFSVAEWAQPHENDGPSAGGALKVVTTHLKPGYLRRNGVPYGEKATVTEYFSRTPETYGETSLIVTPIVEDPYYLFGPFVTSSQFKRLPETNNGWDPMPCSSR
jgi:hypothetical protein